MTTISTILRHYRFDLTKPDEAREYRELLDNTLSKIGFPVWIMRADFDCYSARKPVQDFIEKIRANVGPCELDTSHLFSDQWNTDDAASLRVFNWAECKYANRNIREGYWLEQTDAMREILRNTHTCGYCGKQEPAQKGYVFCPHCLDNEYLKPDDLGLTRMVPVSESRNRSKELTDAERAHLLPLYKAAQLHGATERGKARIARERERIESNYAKSVAKATIKRDAARWIIGNVPSVLENWIYYDHTDKHCFGWRSPLSDGVVSLLLEKISEFPFAYEIKCADGRTLNGY